MRGSFFVFFEKIHTIIALLVLIWYNDGVNMEDRKEFIMKRLFVMIGIAVLILTIASCGGEAATTTARPDTTAPVTTTDTTVPVITTDTTVPVTTTDTTETPVTTAVSIEIEPQNISFSMHHSEFMDTIFDDDGRVIKRDLYHPHTMQKTKENYSYSYDENGKLTSLVIRDIYGDKTVYTFSLSEDGKTATANATDSKDKPYVYCVYFDDSGKIVAEEKETGGANSFYFGYDSQGRLVEERLFEVNYEVTYRFTYRNDTLKITCGAFRTEGLVVTYNNVGLPISLEGEYQTTALHGTFYSYFTYNKKGLCTVARYFKSYEENICEYTYDEEDRLIKSVNRNRDTGYKEELYYTYDAVGNLLKEERKSYDENASLTKWTATEYTYDAKNQTTEKLYITYNEDGSVHYTTGYEYVYDDNGNCIEETENHAGGKRVQSFSYVEDERFLVEEKWYAGDALYSKTIWFLNGKITEKSEGYRYSLEDGSLLSKNEEEYTYGENGVIVQTDYKEYGTDEKLLRREVTEYKNGKSVKITHYDANGNVTKVEEL